MTFQDMLAELDKLTVDEQLRLMEALSQRLRQSARLSAMARLHGALGGGDDTPTTEQVKADYTRYLEEKYR